jgi:hypothetical protein
MSKIDPQRATVFIIVFAIIALCLYSAKHRNWKDTQSTASQEQIQEAQQRAAEARMAAEDAAAKHAAYLARYLNAGFSRKPGVQTVAIVVASENGRLNPSVSTALASHFQNGTVETISSFFTPEFVSDGLFNDVFNGSTSVFNNLELARSLNAVLLARQTVQISKDASMENLVSANMQLEVTLVSVATRGQSQSWTFTANGAGFNTQAARQAAEERLIKQIAKDTRMSL